MNKRPTTAKLSEELIEVQRRWLGLPRNEQDKVYATEFAPAFARLFAELPLFGAPADFVRPRALVSMLGLSWQPVALMAAWAQPEQMLVIGTKESIEKKVGDEGVLSLISRLSGVDAIRSIKVGDPGEADIYRAVRDFIRTAEVEPRQIFLDPTGGKKSMSSSAALAGFIAGTPLVYVDYSEYHAQNRIPVAGTEYPRLLSNPLDVLGDLELRDIFMAFNRSDFIEAQNLAQKLKVRLYEPREAECLALLASAYGAWDRFDFAKAEEMLTQAQDWLHRFSRYGGWGWATAPVFDTIARNKKALGRLVSAQKTAQPSSIKEGRAILTWYLSAAARLLESDKTSLALLLIYAAVERYTDLCLWVDYGLDDENPDYTKIENLLDLQEYQSVGRIFHGKKSYRDSKPAGPLMFSNGIQLLAALNCDRIAHDELGSLKGLSNARNKCEYEHGYLPKVPKSDEVRRYLDQARKIITRTFNNEEEMDEWLTDCLFPVLRGEGEGVNIKKGTEEQVTTTMPL